MRGEISSGRHAKRHPLDWYVDEIWCARQLAAALGGFAREKAQGLVLWDPSCGMGNTLVAGWEHGLRCIGSDVVNNLDWSSFPEEAGRSRPKFHASDFLEIAPPDPFTTIICNPPYSYRKGIAEAFARRALTLATGRVCLLLPNKWLSSQARFDLFMRDHPPAAVLHLTQRPSMPPGDRIGLMGRRAFRGGMIDYCWIVWDVQRPTAPGQTRAIWLPPLDRPDLSTAIEGLA